MTSATTYQEDMDYQMTNPDDHEGLPAGYSKSDYRGELNIESVLTAKYRDILRFMDMDPKMYCSSVESFILGCPEDVTDKCLIELFRLGLERRHYEMITESKIVLYDDLFRFTKRELKKRNIIFRSGTFEIGHD